MFPNKIGTDKLAPRLHRPECSTAQPLLACPLPNERNEFPNLFRSQRYVWQYVLHQAVVVVSPSPLRISVSPCFPKHGLDTRFVCSVRPLETRTPHLTRWPPSVLCSVVLVLLSFVHFAFSVYLSISLVPCVAASASAAFASVGITAWPPPSAAAAVASTISAAAAAAAAAANPARPSPPAARPPNRRRCPSTD